MRLLTRIKQWLFSRRSRADGVNTISVGRSLRPDGTVLSLSINGSSAIPQGSAFSPEDIEVAFMDTSEWVPLPRRVTAEHIREWQREYLGQDWSHINIKEPPPIEPRISDFIYAILIEQEYKCGLEWCDTVITYKDISQSLMSLDKSEAEKLLREDDAIIPCCNCYDKYFGKKKRFILRTPFDSNHYRFTLV